MDLLTSTPAKTAELMQESASCIDLRAGHKSCCSACGATATACLTLVEATLVMSSGRQGLLFQNNLCKSPHLACDTFTPLHPPHPHVACVFSLQSLFLVIPGCQSMCAWEDQAHAQKGPGRICQRKLAASACKRGSVLPGYLHFLKFLHIFHKRK